MKKRNFLCSAILAAALPAILAVSTLPSSVHAEEITENAAKIVTEVQEEASDTAAEDAVIADTAAEDAVTADAVIADAVIADAAAEDAVTADSSAAEEAADATDTQQTGDRTGGASSKTSTTSSVQTVENFEYDITVTFTKQRGTLTDISVTSDTSAKNDNFTSKALAQIAEQLKSGSDVDVVSGATYSSNAILAAIAEAGDYDSVSADLTASLNGTAATSSSQSGSSGKGQSSSGESGQGQTETKAVPANYITYTVSSNTDSHKVVSFQLSEEAQKDNTYCNMVLLVDDEGKHFMPVEADSDETGNGNDYFSYDGENASFTILKDDLTSIEVIFTSDEYGKVHFTVDLTAESGGNEAGAGAKENDPKGGSQQDPAESEQENTEIKDNTAAGTTANSDKTTAASSTGTVKTGDTSSMIFFSVIVLIAAAGFAGLRRMKRSL